MKVMLCSLTKYVVHSNIMLTFAIVPVDANICMKMQLFI